MVFLNVVVLIILLYLFARWGRRQRPIMDGYYVGYPVIEITAWRCKVTWTVGDITGRPLARFRAVMIPAEGVNYIDILYLFRWPAGRVVGMWDRRDAFYANRIQIERSDPEQTSEAFLATIGVRTNKQRVYDKGIH